MIRQQKKKGGIEDGVEGLKRQEKGEQERRPREEKATMWGDGPWAYVLEKTASNKGHYGMEIG